MGVCVEGAGRELEGVPANSQLAVVKNSLNLTFRMPDEGIQESCQYASWIHSSDSYRYRHRDHNILDNLGRGGEHCYHTDIS